MATIAISLSEALTEYENHCVARGVSKGTMRTRKGAVQKLIDVIGDIQVKNINASHVDKLFANTEWQSSTRNARRAIFAQFFKWCRNRKYMRVDCDPLFGWGNLRVPDKQRLRVPVQEYPVLFNACEYPTDTVVVALGLYLFLRSSEIRYIQIKHLDLSNSRISVFRTKTQEWDDMPVCAELQEKLNVYLTWYAGHLADRGIALDKEHYLVPPRISGSMDKVAHRFVPGTGNVDPTRSHGHPHRIVQDVLTRAGYTNQMVREGCHTLRRSGARAYFDALADRGYDGALRRVQAMLGHKQAQVTEMYLGLHIDRETRNKDLAGEAMFPSLQQDNVTQVQFAEVM